MRRAYVAVSDFFACGEKDKDAVRLQLERPNDAAYKKKKAKEACVFFYYYLHHTASIDLESTALGHHSIEVGSVSESSMTLFNCSSPDAAHAPGRTLALCT